MIKILESLQDVESFIKNDLKKMIEDQFPEIRKSPELVGDDEVVEFAINRIADQFPDDFRPESVTVAVVKVQGSETEIVTADHQVLKFNGYLYDFTAHQFTEEYNNLLTFGQVPVIQSRITDDSQVTEGASTVKSYVMVEY